MRSGAILAAIGLTLVVHPAAAQEASHRAEGAFDEGDPRVVVTLLSDARAVAEGERFRVGVHFELDPGWHVYWRNPGDGAMATEVVASGDGVTFGPVRWPVPERFEQPGPIVTYGYSEEVVLLANATVSGDAPDEIAIEAVADFLVCEVECIPDRLTVARTLPVAAQTARDEEASAILDRFAERVPRGPDRAGISVAVDFDAEHTPLGGPIGAVVSVRCDEGRCDSLRVPEGGAAHALFPLRTEGVELRPASVDPLDDGVRIRLEGRASPDPPAGERRLAAVVVLRDQDGAPVRVAFDAPIPPAGPAPAADAREREGSSRSASAPALTLWQVIGLAILGGLLLNLMPCVFPVLAIKALGMIRLASEGTRPRIAHAGAYAGGILLAFAALAGVVVGVRAAGTELGWGFQLQEPLFVAILAAVLVVFALHLFGVLRLSVRADGVARVVDASSGLSRSAGEGVLAVIVATPCTAPFLGTSVGFALASEPAVIVAVFLAVGVGLAAPFVVLVAVPGALRLLPRPGAWMARLEVLLGFALLATVVWLVWLLGRATGADGVARLLAFLLAVALASWAVGTWTLRPDARPRARIGVGLLAAAIAVGAGVVALRFDDGARPARAATAAAWTPEAVRSALDDGRVVFVDFTADWCITCKVNEAIVLEDRRVERALGGEDVVFLVADWTRRDEAIRAELARHGRAGVPLYLVFSPRALEAPEVLPEVLTVDVVLDALRRAEARSPDSV